MLKTDPDKEIVESPVFTPALTLKLTLNILTLPVIFLATSGDRARNVAPKIVSGRVVNTLMTELLSVFPREEFGLAVRSEGKSEEAKYSNSISAPSDFPIQFLWPTFTLFVHSNSSMFFSNLSAYLVILKYHCEVGQRDDEQTEYRQPSLILGHIPVCLFC